MPTTGTYTDARDGQAYRVILMPDGKWWAARNLAWAGAGYDYNNDPAYRYVYGRYYDFGDYTPNPTLAGLMPAGTHCPSVSEWRALAVACGETFWTDYVEQFTTSKMRTSNLWRPYPYDGAPFTQGVDSFWLSLTPAGRGSYGPSWTDFGRVAIFWTSDAQSSYNNYFCQITSQWGVLNSYRASNNPMSIRFIVDSGVVADAGSTLFGASFNGFERGLSCKIKRPILVDDSEGGSVTLTPTASVAFDEWQIEAEFWVPDEYAQMVEAYVPPRGVPLENAIRLPPRNGEASFPGLFPFQATAGYDLYSVPMVTSLESLGRKGPRLDLIGYRIAFSFFAEADGLALNASPTPTTTPPAWLSGKFAAHQIQDWSNQGEVVAATTLAGHPSIKGSFYPVRHGRRRDVNFNLDHLSTDRANELVAFFRGVRHNPVTITLDRGPEGLVATSVYLTELDLQRGAGLWWDGTLKAVLS